MSNVKICDVCGKIIRCDDLDSVHYKIITKPKFYKAKKFFYVMGGDGPEPYSERIDICYECMKKIRGLAHD